MAREYERSTGGGAFSRGDVTDAIAGSKSLAGAARRLQLSPGAHAYKNLRAAIVTFGLSTEHFTESQEHHPRMEPSDVLVMMLPGSPRRRSALLKRALLETGRAESCELCGFQGLWNEKVMAFDLDHVDGDHCNNLAANLRFLCPNCHSQQSTGRPWKNYIRPADELQTLHPEARVPKQIVPKRDACPCGQLKTVAANVCLDCAFRHRARIQWPEPSVLKELIANSTRIRVAADLGVDRKSLWSHMRAYPADQ